MKNGGRGAIRHHGRNAFTQRTPPRPPWHRSVRVGPSTSASFAALAFLILLITSSDPEIEPSALSYHGSGLRDRSQPIVNAWGWSSSLESRVYSCETDLSGDVLCAVCARSLSEGCISPLCFSMP